MRLINANALIAEMHNVILEDGEDRKVFYEVIERQPTIEERKTGVWLEDEDDPESVKTDGYCGYCSVCKEMSEYLTNYCGNCGADMRGTWNETN